MSSKYKPCPFCGGQPELNLGKKRRCQLHGDVYQFWHARCCVINIERPTKEKAIEAWEKRFAQNCKDDLE